MIFLIYWCAERTTDKLLYMVVYDLQEVTHET